jgi:hypothetical protein
LQELPHVIDWVTEEDGLSRNIAHLQKELDYRRKNSGDSKKSKFAEIVFVIDDYDLTCEAFAINSVILAKLGKLVRQDTDLGFHFLISVLPENLMHADHLIKQIRLSRTGISLVNVDTLENLGGRPSPAMRGEEFPSGRGYYFSRSVVKMVQFARPEGAYDMPVKKWKKYKKVTWLRKASEDEIERVRSQSETIETRASNGSDSAVGGFIDMNKAVEMYIKQQKGKKNE